jgi:serine/threonine-protein kinase HipA
MTELAVHLAGRRAGLLIRKDNGNLQFRYDRGYAGPPISWALPIQQEAHPHALCRAVFGGLLPEGDGREALARNLGVSAGNDYALLEEVGGDCAGAVALLDPERPLPTTPEIRWLGVDDLDEVLRDLPQRPLASDPAEGIRLSLAGAQPKTPVIVAGDRVGQPTNLAAPTTHIVKPEPAAFPGLVDNEAFCMDLARAVGLTTARATKRTSASGLPYLLVERYDRNLAAKPIRRLHQEDFCQALGVPSDRKYQNEGGPSVRAAVDLLRSASAVPALDVPRFWEALAFNCLIGNCDAHGKNYSLLYGSGSPTLAPLYDLVSTTLYPRLTTRLAMSIDGATDIGDVTLAAWLDLAASTGLGQRFARDTTARLIDRARAAATPLAEQPRHANDTVAALLARIEAVELLG